MVMSILDVVKAAFGRPGNQLVPLGTGEWKIPPARTSQGYLKAYGEISWLFAVVSKISIGVSEMDWHLYDGTDPETRKEIVDHPLLALLNRPNPFMTGGEYSELQNSYMELNGECFALKVRNNIGVPAQLWPLPPHRMSVVPGIEQFITGYVYTIGDQQIPLEIDQVLHLKMPNPYNPYRGIGAVQATAVDIDTEDFAARWNRNFFYNEGRPDGILRIGGTVPKEDYERFRADWNQKHVGLANAHKTAVIRGDTIDYKQITLSQSDMDFLNLRHLSRDNILGVFGMPGSMMGIQEVGSRARAEADDYIYGRHILRPRYNRYRDLYNVGLVPDFDARLVLECTSPVPENREATIKEAVDTWKAGIIRRNEARAILGRDPDPDDEIGDEYYTPPPSTFGQNPGDVPADQQGKSVKKKTWTDDEKGLAWGAYIEKSLKHEANFKTGIRQLWDVQEERVVKQVSAGLQDVDFVFDEDESPFHSGLQPIIHSTFMESYDNPPRKPVHQGKDGAWSGLSQEALDWIRARSLALAKMVNGTSKDDIRRLLAAGFEAGESIDQLTARIKEYYAGAKKGRAEMVARTETIAASNEGALERYGRDGIEEVEFFAALDERTCEECMDYHGNVMPISEGHELIPVHPNCRCCYLPVVK
jgi:HK97 family phage portal protein